MKRYDVQLGDTLQTIATRFKTTPQAILQHNPAVQGIAPTARLSLGLVLWIADANDHAPATLPPLTGQSYRPRIPPQPQWGLHESLLLNPDQTGTPEFELRIVILLFLRKMEPVGASKTVDIGWRKAVPITPWPPGTFEAFQHNAKVKAEAFWSHRFRLWPPSDYTALNRPTGAGGSPRSVACTLALQLVPNPTSASSSIRCYRRALGETTTALDSAHWTDAVLEDHAPDPLKNRLGRVVPTVNATLAHEVGHLLGLSHSACQGDAQQCYGAGGEDWQIHNVMGAGSQVNRTNATPWLECIEKHTEIAADRWTLHTLDQHGNPLYL